MTRRVIYMLVSVVVLSALLFSCSTKKNTSGSRFYQAFTTRFNVYFNGHEHYREQLKKMEDEYEDDFSDFVYIHPAASFADEKANHPSANFDRTIEKMQKAIALHSIQKKPKKDRGKMRDPKYRDYLKRGEYNPFLHNAWRLMGEAQYLKGDFLASAATFSYIERYFNWLPELVAEAKIWQLRCYTALDWNNEAENVLARLKESELTTNDLRRQYNTAYADYLINQRQYEKAAPMLRQAWKATKGPQKTRLAFLLGQVYEACGDRKNAYEMYGKVAGSSSAPYRTKFNARIKQSEVVTGADIDKEIKSLRRLARKGSNKEYLDQVYYAIGNLYLAKKDTANAIKNYITANEKSTRKGIDKAINQIALGSLYFERAEYDLAQPCYSEGVAQLPEDYPGYKAIKKRSDVLDELAIYSQNVTLQDSLIALAKLTPAEQQAVAERLVAELVEKERKAEEEARIAAAEAAGGANKIESSTQQFTINNDKSWYFYNTATKNAGKTEFQRRWGSRRLEDNWRRVNKATFAMSDFDAGADYSDEEKALPTDSLGNPLSDEEIAALEKSEEQLAHEADPHFPEYYLSQIPQTDEEIANSHNIIQEGLYNVGIILKDKLEDASAAEKAFNELNSRYPDNIYRLDAYYNMYLMYARYGDNIKAEKYRQLILAEFADSNYGAALADPDYINNLRRMESDQEEMYEATYARYLANDNAQVHKQYAEMMHRYPLSPIMPKFMLLDSFAYLGEQDYDKFQSTLKELLIRYPDTDITPMATDILKEIGKGRKPNSDGGGNVRGMIWTVRLSNDTTANANAMGEFTPFDPSREGEHLCLLTYPVDSVSANKLIYDVARHNFSTYAVRDFDMERLTFSPIGIVVIKGFDSYADVEDYASMLLSDKQIIIPQQVRLVFISRKNFDLLLKEGRSFNDYFLFLQEQSDDAVEAPISQ